MKSLPFASTRVKATEAILDAMYSAARVGLKGDNLALASGLLPEDFNRLCELDPGARLAVLQGRADSELAWATSVANAAEAGDAKAALEMLKHVHGWHLPPVVVETRDLTREDEVRMALTVRDVGAVLLEHVRASKPVRVLEHNPG